MPQMDRPGSKPRLRKGAFFTLHRPDRRGGFRTRAKRNLTEDPVQGWPDGIIDLVLAAGPKAAPGLAESPNASPVGMAFRQAGPRPEFQ